MNTTAQTNARGAHSSFTASFISTEARQTLIFLSWNHLQLLPGIVVLSHVVRPDPKKQLKRMPSVLIGRPL